jgi:hypothetical protein
VQAGKSELGAVEKGSLTSLIVYVSRVRDVTTKCLQEVNKVSGAMKTAGLPDNWLADWPAAPMADLHFVTDRVVDGSRELDFEKADFTTPNSTDRVWEVANVDAPQLIAMWKPFNLPTDRFENRPFPFLIYFHPTIGQAADDYAPFPYPFGFAYLYFILRRDAVYDADPLTAFPGPKGIVYQRAHSGKNPVLIVPLNRLGKEVGVFLKAEEAESLLREIQGMMQRRNRNHNVPQLGHVGLCGFSAGCGILMNSFLSKSQDHPFTKKILKEIYLLDPKMNAAELSNQVMKWANGDPANKRLRVYLSAPDANYLKVVGATSFPPIPFERSTSDGMRTLVVTSIPDWPKAAKKRGAPKQIVETVGKFGPVHELHAAMFVTHALRRSGFDEDKQ